MLHQYILFQDIIIATEVKTDINGVISIPSVINGQYSIDAYKDGYIMASANKTIDCIQSESCICDTSLTLHLDQPRCDPNLNQSVIILPVEVRDNLTNQFIEGALVSLTLVNSLSGPSVIPVDNPRFALIH